jgi:NTP pyrophosphatase (non-canonical NTP hydrolase)
MRVADDAPKGGDMPELGVDPTLAALQRYVTELEVERGFAEQTVLDKCLLLGEEVGELFKAIRKSAGLLIDESSSIGEVGEELADILIYLCAIANRRGIDLEAAFRGKEARNHTRTWESAN